MPDDAQTPEARDNASAHWPTPPTDTGAPWAAPAGTASDAAEVPLAEGAEPEVDLGKGERGESVPRRGEPMSGSGEAVADARPEPDPWAPPADGTGPGTTVVAGEHVTWPAPSAPSSSPTSSPSSRTGPSVHDQQTVTSNPSTGTPSAASDANQARNPVTPHAGQGQPQAPQPWANPFAPPTPTPPPSGSANPFAPPPPANGSANPFAPPAPAPPYAHGEPVPPPPMAPDGPGQVPYGYPGGQSYPAGQGYQAGPGYLTGQGYPAGHGGPAGHGYPAGPGYPAQSGAGYYGWPGMQPMPANGMGTAGLVLGILAAVVFCLWPLAIVLGILAVIFGMLGRGKARRGEATNSGQALGGIICGAIGIALGIGMFVLVVAI